MVHLLHRLYGVDAPGAEYCDERVCLSVCVFVGPQSYLRNFTPDLHQIFYACYLWPCLGPPLAAKLYTQQLDHLMNRISLLGLCINIVIKFL